MKNKFFYILFLLFTVMAAGACGSTKDGTKKSRKSKCKKMTTSELQAELFEKADIPFDHFYTRIGVDIKSNTMNQWFATSIKMRIDSAFSGTVRYTAYVAGTFIVTQDSVIFNNKADKCYLKHNFSYISSKLGTEVTYDFFQDLLLGLPIGIDKDLEYQQITDKEYPNHYILSSHKKKVYKQLERGENPEKDEILIQYHMRCKDFELERINIQIPSDTVNMTIHYKDKKVESGFTVPNITHITIVHPRDSIKIEVNSGVVKINQPKKIFIKTPDSYNECP